MTTPADRSCEHAALISHAPVALFSVLYLYAACNRASSTPLWFDEIFTYHISNLDGPRAIVDALIAKIDIHPPLDYIARHYSMSWFDTSEFFFRLPSIIAFLVAVLCLYIFVLRRTSLLPALVAFALPFVTLAVRYSYEGRGYAFLMASMCLSLLAWQLVAEKVTALRLVFLFVALSLGPFSHFYGVLNYVPIIAGEAWRWWQQQRVSWPIFACIVLSVASLAFLLPLILNASEFSGTFWTEVAPGLITNGYVRLFGNAVPGIVGCLLAFAAVAFFAGRTLSPNVAAPEIPRYEILAAVLICLLPFTTYAVAEFVTRAYTAKYLLNTVFGVAILTAYFVHYAMYWRKVLALLMLIAIGSWSAASMIQLGFSSTRPASLIDDRTMNLIRSSSVPVLVYGAHHFLFLHRYLSLDSQDKLHYASNAELAVKHVGEDVNERALSRLQPFVTMNLVDLCDFTTAHKKFLVVAPELTWEVRNLVAERSSTATVLGIHGDEVVLSVSLVRPIGC